MAANGASDGRGDQEGFVQHDNRSGTLSEGRGQDMRESVMPEPTSMTPVTVPDVPWMRVDIRPGFLGASVDIHPLDQTPGSSEEATDTLYLEQLASYHCVNSLSHFTQESLQLGPLMVQTSRSIAECTGRRILSPLHAGPSSSEVSRRSADQRNDPTNRRLLLHLDATAAYTLRGIEFIIIVFPQASGTVCQWVVARTSQLRDVATYFNEIYRQEASKWAGTSDIVVICGDVSLTVAVGAFDAVLFVADWFFNGKEAREMENATSV